MLEISKDLELEEIAERYHLNNIMLFGSSLTDEFNEYSDIDIAVLGTNPLELDALFELEDFFENQFHRTIDVVDLRSESLDFFIKVNILNTAQVIFDSDSEKMLTSLKEQVERYYRENENFFYFRRMDVLS